MMILLVTFSAYGLEVYLKAQAEDRMAAREGLSRQAVYAAEGGIEWVKAELEMDPSFTGGSKTIGKGRVTTQVSSGEGGYWVTSEAQYGLARRKIRVFLQQDETHWVMSHYEELHQ